MPDRKRTKTNHDGYAHQLPDLLAVYGFFSHGEEIPPPQTHTQEAEESGMRIRIPTNLEKWLRRKQI